MDLMGGEDELVEAVSPIGQYLNNSVLSLSVLSVFEFEVPIDDSLIMQSVKDTLVSLSPRFSSIMAGSRYILSTLRNTSMGITNLIGPIEKISFADHPIQGFYFAVSGTSQNLSVSIVSYMGELRIGLVVEKDFIDAQKLKSCVEGAFDMTLKAARENEVPVAY